MTGTWKTILQILMPSKVLKGLLSCQLLLIAILLCSCGSSIKDNLTTVNRRNLPNIQSNLENNQKLKDIQTDKPLLYPSKSVNNSVSSGNSKLNSIVNDLKISTGQAACEVTAKNAFESINSLATAKQDGTWKSISNVKLVADYAPYVTVPPAGERMVVHKCMVHIVDSNNNEADFYIYLLLDSEKNLRLKFEIIQGTQKVGGAKFDSRGN